MTTVVRGHPFPQDVLDASVKPPQWVADLLHQPDIELRGDQAALFFNGADVALAMACVRGAQEMNVHQLREGVVTAYGSIAAQLAATEVRHPVRFWNFIPHLNQMMGDGCDRYMVFNAGRHAAFAKWFGRGQAATSAVPTASGVGHFGRDLFIWCLASRSPGDSVENPQQHPSCRYSSRYGPLPPCFARATKAQLTAGSGNLQSALLVGGTASIRGEDTISPDSLPRQTLITLQNLAMVVKSASLNDRSASVTVNGDLHRWLACFRHLRVYHPRPQDQPTLARLIEPRVCQVDGIEWIRAPLCRPELLVEIEGVALFEGL